MIAKTGVGKSFKGLSDYLQKEAKNSTILKSDGVRTTSPKAMAFDFHQQAKYNERTVKSVGHDSLSFSKSDRDLSDKAMEKIALEYMDKMGYKNTQFAIIRHHDTDHQHCHIIYNRVNNDGKTITDKFNYHKANVICRELEQEYDLIQVDGSFKSKQTKLSREEKETNFKFKPINTIEKPTEEVKKGFSL